MIPGIASQPALIRIQDSEMIYLYVPSSFNSDQVITNDFVCENIVSCMGNPLGYTEDKDVDDYFDRINIEPADMDDKPYTFYRCV